MKFIDLFGGIGGFSLGMERSGHECAGYYEWDKYCVQIYNRNFRTDYKPTDITKLDAGEIPDFGCLCAGFPCQPFSIAGKRQGFQDIRGTLFAEIVRITEAKRPGLLFLENVKGLLNHDNGETFATILHSLSELGYALEWEVLNSKNFGVPQNRERVFIIGHLGEGCPEAVFPVGQGSKDIIQVGKNKEGQEDVAWALRGRDYKDGTNFVYEKELIELTEIPQPASIDMYHFQHGEKRPWTSRVMFDGNHATLQAGSSHGLINNNRIRRLTPTECERLQGFPDGWTEGVSDTQRYKMLGNAVTVNVIEEIAKRLTEVLE